jgi:TolA-binding protein
MQSLDSGSADLVISYRETDITISIRIRSSEENEAEMAEETAEGVEGAKGFGEALSGKNGMQKQYDTVDREQDEMIVEDRVEALKKRIMAEDKAEADPESPNDSVGVIGERSAREEMPVPLEDVPEEDYADAPKEETPVSDQQEAAVPKRPELERDEIYYVDENNQIVKVSRTPEEELYHSGRRYFRNEEYDRAEQELLQYISRCKKCNFRDESRFLLVEIALHSDNEEAALEILHNLSNSKAVQTVLKAVERRAELHHRAGRYGDALNDYEQVYNSGNRDISTLQILGDLYYLQEEYSRALLIYEEGVAHGMENDTVAFRIASIYDAPGPTRNIEKAYQYYLLITTQFQNSEYYQRAAERIVFFEENFFDYQ